MTGLTWIENLAPLGLLSSLLVACAAHPRITTRESADANDVGRTLPPKNAMDRAVLQVLTRLPSDTPSQVMHGTVVAGAPYASASGRTCRELHVREAAAVRATERLACTSGAGWFFVPEVLGNSDLPE